MIYMKLSTKLAGAMICLANKAEQIEKGQNCKKLIQNGKAYDKFLEIVKAQGGDISYLNNPEKYPSSKFHDKVIAQKSGYISKIDTYEIGMASLELGAGRKTKEDKIDPKAGIIFKVKIGTKVKKKKQLQSYFLIRKRALNRQKIE